MEGKAEAKTSSETKAVEHKCKAKETQNPSALTMSSAAEAMAEAKVEDEWEAMLNNTPNSEGSISISNDPEARRLLDGFRINWMNMRDASVGRLLWEKSDWADDMFTTEQEAHVPKNILECSSVSREINFSSEELMEHFRLEQSVYFQGSCMEEWFFDFGFVIPGSTNTWQHTIYAAEKEMMLPASLLSGNITIETRFFNGSLFVCKSLMRIYYE